MRDVKFRCWDKKTNKWVLNNTIDEWEGAFESGSTTVLLDFNGELRGYIQDDGGKNGLWEHNQEIEKDRLVLMQFTGLRDCKGKEIYEGDIVRVSEPDEDSCMGKEFVYSCEVCFGGGDYSQSFTLKCEKYYRGYALLSYRHNVEIEVIGDIYSNPELIPTQEGR